MMKKIYILLLCSVVLLSQACKKKSDDTTTTTTTTTYLMSATFNGTAWNPTDTLSANITYTAATKTKVLNITGTNGLRRLTFAVTLSNAASTNDFPISSYNVDANLNPLMVYSRAQTDANNNVTYVTVATAQKGNGTIRITGVDATKQTITGTFTMSDVQTFYDSNGNITSINNTSITGGALTALPYTFINK